MKKKAPKGNHTAWSHHETMITNLRDWVSREINMLHIDMHKELPHLEDEPHIRKVFSVIEDHKKSLFETLSDLREVLEREATKAAKKAKVVAEPEDEMDSIEA